MNRGFYIILSAQFFSALADNALLFSALALLKELSAPQWKIPVLQQFFVFAYVLLAPFVGPFADALPKGRVMFISNAVKLIGCFAMLLGLEPLYAYAITGIGAAMYSPAKYGILTEYLPPEKLVPANGWMEGLTVAAIILGAIIGSFLASPENVQYTRLLFDIPGIEIGIDSAPKFALTCILGLYIIAAAFNLFIPKLALDHKIPNKSPLYLLHDFWHCFKLLWRDRLGQVSLAVTTLFWGAGATLRLIVLEWSEDALDFNQEKGAILTGIVAIGIAIGSVIAAKFVKLEKAVRVLPVGILMGALVISMVFINEWRIAVVVLSMIGVFAGYFVVPMNALLQHRGHLLMGAGHSIAVQNFNENLCILMMLGMYALLLRVDFSIYHIVVIFGLFVSLTMTALYRIHRNDVFIGTGKENHK